MTLKHSDILSWLLGLLLPLSSMQAVESHHASDSHDASERISVHAEKNIGSTGSSISRYYSTSWVQTGSDVALWFYLSFAMKLWSHKPSSVLIVSCYFHTGVDGSLISFLHFCKGNSFASNLDFFCPDFVLNYWKNLCHKGHKSLWTHWLYLRGNLCCIKVETPPLLLGWLQKGN